MRDNRRIRYRARVGSYYVNCGVVPQTKTSAGASAGIIYNCNNTSATLVIVVHTTRAALIAFRARVPDFALTQQSVMHARAQPNQP